MSRLPEPRRLLSRSPKDSSLVLALTAARARAPRAAELQALEESLLGVIGSEPREANTTVSPPALLPGEMAGTVAVSGAGGNLVAKVGALVVTAGLVLGGLWWSLHQAAVAPIPAFSELPAPQERSPQANPSEQPAPSSDLATPDRARAPACANPPCTRARLPALPVARRRVDPQAASPDAALSARATDAALSELQLIDEAREALRSSPARALALADQHKRQFPHGSMAEEREVIAISALVAMGQTTRARALATTFLRANSGSAYARRVEATLSSMP